jgi:hypothetical protein
MASATVGTALPPGDPATPRGGAVLLNPGAGGGLLRPGAGDGLLNPGAGGGLFNPGTGDGAVSPGAGGGELSPGAGGVSNPGAGGFPLPGGGEGVGGTGVARGATSRVGLVDVPPVPDGFVPPAGGAGVVVPDEPPVGEVGDTGVVVLGGAVDPLDDDPVLVPAGGLVAPAGVVVVEPGAGVVAEGAVAGDVGFVTGAFELEGGRFAPPVPPCPAVPPPAPPFALVLPVAAGAVTGCGSNLGGSIDCPNAQCVPAR